MSAQSTMTSPSRAGVGAESSGSRTSREVAVGRSVLGGHPGQLGGFLTGVRVFLSVAGTDKHPRPSDEEIAATTELHMHLTGQLLWLSHSPGCVCQISSLLEVNSQRVLSASSWDTLELGMQLIRHAYNQRHRGIRFRSDGHPKLRASHDASDNPDPKDGKSSYGFSICLFDGSLPYMQSRRRQLELQIIMRCTHCVLIDPYMSPWWCHRQGTAFSITTLPNLIVLGKYNVLFDDCHTSKFFRHAREARGPPGLAESKERWRVNRRSYFCTNPTQDGRVVIHRSYFAELSPPTDF